MANLGTLSLNKDNTQGNFKSSNLGTLAPYSAKNVEAARQIRNIESFNADYTNYVNQSKELLNKAVLDFEEGGSYYQDPEKWHTEYNAERNKLLDIKDSLEDQIFGFGISKEEKDEWYKNIEDIAITLLQLDDSVRTEERKPIDYEALRVAQEKEKFKKSWVEAEADKASREAAEKVKEIEDKGGPTTPIEKIMYEQYKKLALGTYGKNSDTYMHATLRQVAKNASDKADKINLSTTEQLVNIFNPNLANRVSPKIHQFNTLQNQAKTNLEFANAIERKYFTNTNISNYVSNVALNYDKISQNDLKTQIEKVEREYELGKLKGTTSATKRNDISTLKSLYYQKFRDNADFYAVSHKENSKVNVDKEYVSPSELELLTYLKNKGLDEEYDNFLSYIEPFINERKTVGVQTWLEEYFKEDGFWNTLGQIGLDLLSTPLNIVGGVVGFVSNTFDTLAYRDADINSWTHWLSNTGESIRNARQKTINDDFGNFLYQTFMAINDSASVIVLGQWGSLILGAAAAESAFKDRIKQGDTTQDAFYYSLAVGLIEVITEKISIENLVKFKDINSFSPWFSQSLKQAGVETSEESISEILNKLSDKIFHGDYSESNKKIQEYIKKGMSYAEAQKRVLTEDVKDVFVAGASGALSGFFMGSGGNALQYYNGENADLGKSIIENKNLLNLDKQALQMGVDSKIDQIFKQVSKDGGYSNKSLAKIGKIYQKLVNKAESDLQTAKTTEFSTALTALLAENNITNPDLVNVITKAMFDKGLTQSEIKLFNENNGKEIVNSLLNDTNLNNEIKAKISSRAENLQNLQNMTSETVNVDYKYEYEVNLSPSTESAFGEVSAQKPKADFILDTAAEVSGVQRLSDEQRYIKDLCNRMGIKVVIDDLAGLFKDTDKPAGFSPDGFTSDDGTIYLDYNTVDPIRFVFKHELTHYGENSKEFSDFCKAVKKSKAFEKWLKTHVKSVNTIKGQTSVPRMAAAYRQRIIDHRAENGVDLSPLDAEIEMIANFVGETLFAKDTSSLEDIFEGMSVSDKNAFLKFLDRFITWLKEKLKGNLKYTQEIAKLEQMYSSLVKTAKERYDKGEIAKTVNEKFSISSIDKNIGNDVKFVSRANKEGELINDFYNALDKSEWKSYYDAIASNKYLEKTEPSDIIVIAVGNKLLISERQYTGKDAHDFQVIDAYSFEGDNSYLSYEIASYLESEDITYDSRTIEKTISSYLRLHAEEEFSRRYDRIGGRFVSSDTTTAKQVQSNRGTEQIYTDQSGRKANDSPSERDIQEVSDKINNIEATSNEGAFSIPDTSTRKVSIEDYTEEQYNNFGWITDNNLVSANERETLFSRYADYKHNGDKYPSTRFGEAVIHSTECPDVIAYIKGSIGNPEITKIVRIQASNETISEIKEDVLHNEYRQIPFPYQNVIDCFGEEILTIHKRKDYETFRQVKARTERERSETVNTDNRTSQDGTGSLQQNSTTDRADGITSAFSMPKKFSISQKQRATQEAYDSGDISRDEFVRRSQVTYEEALDEGGIMPDQDGYAVPKTIDGRKVSRFAKTILKEGGLSDRQKEEVGSQMLQGGFTYEASSNKDDMEYATGVVNDGDGSQIWRNAFENKTFPTTKEIAVGEALLKQAIASGDTAKIFELTTQLNDMFTRAGQTAQAAKMFTQMTGIGRLMTLQRFVDRTNKDLQKRTNTINLITLDKTLAEQIAKTQSGEDAEVFVQEAIKDIAEQLPLTFLDKWNAWRYMSMLTNPKTHIRNIIGNAIMLPVTRLKDTFAYLMESLPSIQRTKSLILKKEYKEFAKEFAKSKDIQKLLQSGENKYTLDVQFANERKIFTSKWTAALETLRNKNSDWLSMEDMWFKNIYFKRTLAEYLQAKNVDLDKIPKEVLNEAVNRAKDEAYKNTFNSTSKVAKILSKYANRSKGFNVAINSVLPFKQTPINIVSRGVEYSPIGLLTTIVKGLKDLKNGKFSAEQFIDGLATNLTGSLIFALGMLLQELGWATGGFDDDSEEDKFRKLNGEQEYSLQVFGKSYTLDWAAPSNIPFFLGVEFSKALEEDNIGLGEIADTILTALNPIIEMSMLQGIENTLSAVRYEQDAKSIEAIIKSSASSYISQSFPTVFGAIARTFDNKARDAYYTDKNSPIPSVIQELMGNVQSKVPGWENQLPERVNAWGEADTSGFAERLFENFISPGYLSDINYSNVDNALLDLYEATGETSIFPSKPKKFINIYGDDGKKSKKVNLSAKQYEKFAKLKGQYSYDYVSEFVNGKLYDKLEPTLQVKVIEDLYSYANARAETEVMDTSIDPTQKNAYKYEESGKSVIIYFISKALTSVSYADYDSSGGVSKAEKQKALSSLSLDADTKAAIKKAIFG